MADDKEKQKDEELNDDQLDQVSGGGKGGDYHGKQTDTGTGGAPTTTGTPI